MKRKIIADLIPRRTHQTAGFKHKNTSKKKKKAIPSKKWYEI